MRGYRIRETQIWKRLLHYALSYQYGIGEKGTRLLQHTPDATEQKRCKAVVWCTATKSHKNSYGEQLALVVTTWINQRSNFRSWNYRSFSLYKSGFILCTNQVQNSSHGLLYWQKSAFQKHVFSFPVVVEAQTFPMHVRGMLLE